MVPQSIACALLLTAAHSTAAEAGDWLLELASPALRAVTQQIGRAQQQLDAAPNVGQTSVELGYQHPRLAAPPLTDPWVQIDLGSTQPLDWIALFPAQVDWQSFDRPAYGFPRRFRIDISDDPQFREFTTVANLTDADFEDPGIAPVAFPAGGKRGRHIRLTVSKLATENGQYFYALAELMALAGNRNVAIGRPLKASASSDIAPRWALANLVDGRTPLGPPIHQQLLPYDGLYMGKSPEGTMPAVTIDLGRVESLQEVRIHPIHARIGADIPGFAFPQRWRVAASADPDFSNPTVLLDSRDQDFPNPGNNPVTLPAGNCQARYLRIELLQSLKTAARRFGLSEVEIYAGGENVAHGASVDSDADTAPLSAKWPRALLVDGFTSYGRLIELPAWLAAWNRQRELRTQLRALAAQRLQLRDQALRRLGWAGGGATLLLAIGALSLWTLARRRREQDMKALRLRLARDLHDEIGSNLAGISVLSEIGANASPQPAEQAEDWREVHRVALETMDSMREVLWLMDVREEGGPELMTHLQLVARRMLGKREVIWQSTPEQAPASLDANARRQIFLFFKEALNNIIRHSNASAVQLAVEQRDGCWSLQLVDNGVGFNPGSKSNGLGLASLQQRARRLKGRATIDSTPGQGTRIRLEIKL